MIVTIDGPAGAGKSSAARQLAARLGFEFLDTGAMYRAVTFAALDAAIDLNDQSALERILPTLHLDMTARQITLNGIDITSAIRAPRITAASGAIANSPIVRRHLVQWQRRLATGNNIVCEGRDQGTVVFPDAACKFFLVADPAERARRRLHDLQARGDSMTLDEVRTAQDARDARDAARVIAPMVPAADAIILDSTALELAAVVERMENEVRKRL